VRYATGQLDKAKLLLRYVEPIAALSLGDAVVPNADVEVILGRSFTGIQVPADRLEVTTALPGDTVIEQPLEQPLELPQPPPSVELPNPAPRGNC
jgi:hypothetical protein